MHVFSTRFLQPSWLVTNTCRDLLKSVNPGQRPSKFLAQLPSLTDLTIRPCDLPNPSCPNEYLAECLVNLTSLNFIDADRWFKSFSKSGRQCWAAPGLKKSMDGWIELDLSGWNTGILSKMDFFKNILRTYEGSDLNDWLNEWVIVGKFVRSYKENIVKKHT